MESIVCVKLDCAGQAKFEHIVSPLCVHTSWNDAHTGYLASSEGAQSIRVVEFDGFSCAAERASPQIPPQGQLCFFFNSAMVQQGRKKKLFPAARRDGTMFHGVHTSGWCAAP
jgi:hypothetical protein